MVQEQYFDVVNRGNWGASAFVESTLAQIYKVKDGNAFRGAQRIIWKRV